MHRLFACVAFFLLASCASRDTRGPWPQAAVPHATWIAPEACVAIECSAVRGENIRWKCALPNAGQGGIAVVGDRV